MNDDHKRGRVCAFLTSSHRLLGELDEALVTGSRALEITGRLGDLRLRILTTTFLAQAHYYRGEYERVVELAVDNLAAGPADSVYETFGAAQPASVFDRVLLVLSLAELGRFAEAAEYEAEAIRLAEPTQHAYTIGVAHRAAATLHLLKGDWAKARSLVEYGITVARTGNVVLLLPLAVASSAWVLAQLGEADEALNRLREAEQLLERQALALAEPRGMRPLIAHCHLGLGKLYRRTGKREQAREHLTTATTMYREMEMRFWLGPAEAELTEVRA